MKRHHERVEALIPKDPVRRDRIMDAILNVLADEFQTPGEEAIRFEPSDIYAALAPILAQVMAGDVRSLDQKWVEKTTSKIADMVAATVPPMRLVRQGILDRDRMK